MQELTPEECELVVGGADPTATGTPPGSSTPTDGTNRGIGFAGGGG